MVLVAALAGVATQAPRWRIEEPIPGHRAAPAGQALRVEVEASLEPSFFADSGGAVPWWTDAPAPAPWSGRGVFHFDAGLDPARVGIDDTCGPGNRAGLCSGCDPPPGAHVRVLSVGEVDVWSIAATAAVAAGPGSRVEVEVESTRTPLVLANGTERCTLSSTTGPRAIHACWVDGAATISAAIRGACSGGPCAPPAGEKLTIVRAARTP